MNESSTYNQLVDHIEKLSGINLKQDKKYLIESRLTKMLVEYSCDSYFDFYKLILENKHPELKDKLLDAITTNETYWFRDKKPWIYLEEVLLPKLVENIINKKINKVRIWSAASSTGQESYSTAICINEYLEKNKIKNVSLNNFEIVGTDISREVLKIASNARYNRISIMRGLDDKLTSKYFEQNGRVYTLNEKIRNVVKFKNFNLLDSFNSLGKFDIIFCRYVLIYFSKELKTKLLEKFSKNLGKDGIFIVGASEILPDYSNFFNQIEYKNGVYYKPI